MASRRHRSATRNEHDRVGKEEGNPVRAKRAWVHQRRLHVVPKLPCAARRTPGRAAPWPGWWATPPAGDLNHALVQLDESAIAGKFGRDLAFAARRLAACSHPGVDGCAAAPWSLTLNPPGRDALVTEGEHESLWVQKGDQGGQGCLSPTRHHDARACLHPCCSALSCAQPVSSISGAEVTARENHGSHW